MKTKAFALFFLLLALSLCGLWMNRLSPVSKMEETIKPVFPYKIVIDPGHGGVDSGASSVTGLYESGINLDCSLRMAALWRFLGVDPVLTRETDVSIHDPSAKTIAAKKVSDLKNRAKLVNEIPNAILISIHQNTFPQASASGSEVLWGKAPESEGLAKIIHEKLLALNPDNRRVAKKIGKNFLLEEVNKPSVLIECGFITNPKEEILLRSREYQLKLSMSIASGVLEWAGMV